MLYDSIWTVSVLTVALLLTLGLVAWGRANETPAWRSLTWLAVIVFIPVIGPVAYLLVRAMQSRRAHN